MFDGYNINGQSAFPTFAPQSQYFSIIKLPGRHKRRTVVLRHAFWVASSFITEAEKKHACDP